MEVPMDTSSFADISGICTYNCTFENLQHTDCEVLDNSYIVQWEDDHPHEIRQSTPNAFFAAKTYGRVLTDGRLIHGRLVQGSFSEKSDNF